MTTWYISPQGNDNAAGSEKAPFATIERGVDAIRIKRAEYRRCKQFEQLRIVLLPGIHRLQNTLVLNCEDGGDKIDSLIFEAAKTGSATISSGFILNSWKKVENEPDYIPENARGKLWVHKIPFSGNINTLYSTNGLIPRARGKGITPLNKKTDLHNDRFYFNEGDIPACDDITEAEAVIIPKWPWTMNILPVKRLDTEKKELFLSKPHTYPIGQPDRLSGGSVWIENSLSIISPGTWVFHKASSLLYYWPLDNKPESNLEVALLTELIRVEGIHDEDDVYNHSTEWRGKLEHVSGITFKNIVFTHANRFPFNGQTGKGLQHDWEMHDAPSCMLRFRHAQLCCVDGCTFTHAGSGGLRFDLACRDNSIVNNCFSHLGGCAIVLCGYGLGYQYLNLENEIKNNTIYDIGLLYWHSPGIFIWQSGANTVAENHIYDLPYTGIVCSGRSCYDRNGTAECSKLIDWTAVEKQLGKHYQHNDWFHGGITDWSKREPLMHSRENLIEFNRIHDVMRIMGDGNGIYISGAGGGNVVRFNLVGPCPSDSMSEGIRCDDDQHQTIIHGNLIFGMGGRATGITLKGVNRVTNNIIALPYSDYCKNGMLSLETGPLNGSVIQYNVIFTQKPEQTLVSERRIHGYGRKALLRDCHSNRNLYYCIEAPELGRKWINIMRGFGNDLNSICLDPGFQNAHENNYNLCESSPLYALGFQPLPLNKMFSIGNQKEDV